MISSVQSAVLVNSSFGRNDAVLQRLLRLSDYQHHVQGHVCPCPACCAQSTATQHRSYVLMVLIGNTNHGIAVHSSVTKSRFLLPWASRRASATGCAKEEQYERTKRPGIPLHNCIPLHFLHRVKHTCSRDCRQSSTMDWRWK